MLRHLRRYHSSAFQIGDLCLLRQVNKPDKKWLTKPLTLDTVQKIYKGAEIKHDDIIGALPRSKVIQTSNNLRFSVTRPTLEEFVELSERDAQPIYSQDAASMVYLADLHVDFPQIVDGKVVDKKQFLEAGTGHGSLTLAIARLIHLGNALAGDSKDLRGAVLNTIDNREQHSKRGKKNLSLFNNGMYQNDVDFHVDESPSAWLLKHELQGTEFLNGAFLDMPDPDMELEMISRHLKINSPFVIFAPSITQVLKIVKTVNERKLDIRLTFTKCVELATGGLKVWDVRETKIRATGEIGDVARPKVGDRVVGGGFVAVFRKIGNFERKLDEAEDEAEVEIESNKDTCI